VVEPVEADLAAAGLEGRVMGEEGLEEAEREEAAEADMEMAEAEVVAGEAKEVVDYTHQEALEATAADWVEETEAKKTMHRI
jgi:hypothetical protein